MTARTDAILAQEFAALADGQVADALNAQTVQVDGDSPILTISNARVVTQAWGRITDDIETHADKTRREFLRNAMYLFDAKGADTIGWGDSPEYPPAIAAILDGLIAYGYIDADFKTFVMAQRYVTVPVWDPPITHLEVAKARRG